MEGFIRGNGIELTSKDADDRNAVAVVDRAIGLIKKKAAEMDGDWNETVPKAVRFLNKTPKTEVLHGSSPNEVKDNPEAHFMLQQDNAEKLQGNEELHTKRVDALNAAGGFKAPTTFKGPTKRVFEPSFKTGVLMSEGMPSVGRVRAGGKTYNLKRIRPVRV